MTYTEDLIERHPICGACGCDLHSGSCDGAEFADRPRISQPWPPPYYTEDSS